LRPNYFVIATEDGRLLIYGLYYNGKKAERAGKRLRTQNTDGSYTIFYEDGRSETVSRVTGEVRVRVGFLGDYLITDGPKWKKTFFDTTETEFEEIAKYNDLPVKIVKEMANHERDYVENRGDTRWNAWKRTYLPWLYNSSGDLQS